MLEKLPKLVEKSKKRVGRGHGSGKGAHTAGRGQKGQKSRGSVGLMFEGTKMRKSLIKRMPFLRGKGKFKSLGTKSVIVNLKFLELLPADTVVTLAHLVKMNIISTDQAKFGKVKILGDGAVTKAFTIKLPISKQAADKIKKAGGKVMEPERFEEKVEKVEKAEKKETVKKTKTKAKKTTKSSK
jgi:large subunit ribosomal protein L15